MPPHSFIARNKVPPVFDSRRVDDAICRVTGKRIWQGDRRGCNHRRSGHRPNVRGQRFEPRTDRDIDVNPPVLRQPRKLEPRDACDCQFAGCGNCAVGTGRQHVRFGRQPVDHVGVKKESRHALLPMPLQSNTSLPRYRLPSGQYRQKFPVGIAGLVPD